MAYDYSQYFLRQHRKTGTVDQLIALAKAEGISRLEYETPEEVRSAQYLINNILASIAFHMPENAKVRQTIRTWTSFEHDKWVLFVGKPLHRIGGARHRSLADLKITTNNNDRTYAELDPLQRYSKTIDGQEAWSDFVSWMFKREAPVDEVMVDFARPLDMTDISWMNFEGWEMKVTSPTTFRYRRTK